MEETWTEDAAKSGQRYQPPVLVLFNDAVQSACGSASAATWTVLLSRATARSIWTFRFSENSTGDSARRVTSLRRTSVAHEVGSPRSNPARHQSAGPATAAARQWRPRRGQRPLGEARTTGRLFRGGVGIITQHRTAARSGRRGRRPEGRLRVGDNRLRSSDAGHAYTGRALRIGEAEQRAHWLRQGLHTGSSTVRYVQGSTLT